MMRSDAPRLGDGAGRWNGDAGPFGKEGLAG